MAVVITIFVALLVALAVFVVASANATQESMWTAFRRAVRARRHPAPEDEAAERAASVEPVDLSLAEFLRATVSEGDGYLNPDELVDNVREARDRAAQALHVPRPRRQRAGAVR